MASIEERLKQYIKDHYGSVRAFVLAKNLNYANVDSILRRGIKNATWNSVKTLCEALEISADELAEDRIVSVSKTKTVINLENTFESFKQQIQKESNLTINDMPVSEDEVQLLIVLLDNVLEVIKKKRMI